jgi:hypothetical protein
MNNFCVCDSFKIKYGSFTYRWNRNIFVQGREKQYYEVKNNLIRDVVYDKELFDELFFKKFDDHWTNNTQILVEILQCNVTRCHPGWNFSLFCDKCVLEKRTDRSINKSNIRCMTKTDAPFVLEFCLYLFHFIHKPMQKIKILMQMEREARREDLAHLLHSFMPRDMVPAVMRYIDWA